MKKFGKIRKTGVALTALSVSAAMLATGLTLHVPSSVHAEEAKSGSALTEVALFDGYTVPTKCDYGKSFEIRKAPENTSVKVSAPNGTEVKLGEATGDYYSVDATQIGNYVVTYYNTADNSAAYSFSVYVTLDKEYILKVADNGASIPTRMKVNGKFKLPEARVVYYDDNKILRSYPGDFTVSVTDSIGDAKNPTGHSYKVGDEVTASQTGKMYITYSAQIEDKKGGKKYIGETFTVNVQSEFDDKQAPTIAVSGITSNISVNRSVTLPTATVSDDYDENVRVEISVLGPDNQPVKVVDVNKYGYAYQDATKLAADKAELAKPEAERDPGKLNYPDVAFDNADIMSFYPLATGQYKVQYTAYDDAGNSSTVKSWIMNAGDSSSPVFEEIDEWKIPDKWGVSVSNAKGNVNAGIELPVPLIVDNKDHMKSTGAEDKDLLSLYVRVTDSDYNRDIITFSNVLANPEDKDTAKANACKYKSDGTIYGDKDEQFVFSQYSTTPFVFDISKYHRKDKDGKDVDKNGTYTVYYRASDAAGNRQSKTFTIDIAEEYEDTTPPTVADISVPAYISASDETFNIPTVEVKDSGSSSVHTEYRIYSDNGGEDKEGGRYITVDGGEVADVEIRENGDKKDLYLVIDSGKEYAKELKIADNMYFCVTATDAVGNVTCNSDEVETGYTIDNYSKSDDVVTVINSSSKQVYKYEPQLAVKTVKTRDEKGKVTAWEANATPTAGEKVNAGGFTISLTDPDMRKYVGFEVSVQNEKGNAIDTTLDTYTSYDDSSAKIYVKNIEFTPSNEGAYYINVRVFDVNDVNSVYTYKIDVKSSASSGGTVKPAAAEAVPTNNGSINKKYTLTVREDEYANSEAGKTYYHARRISGGVYSLMGGEFIAKSQGSYSITDGFVDSAKLDSYSDIGADFLADGIDDGKYGFSVTDSEKPVIDLQGIMPTYAQKNAKITIPSIIAYSANGSADVKVEVKFDGKKVDITHDEKTNEYTFEGKQDGVYTVKVTAKRADASETTANYEINVGDVIAPEFNVKGGTSGRKQQGDVFTYGEIKLSAQDEADKANLTITKKIYDPSGAEVSGASISGTYNSYYNKTNNGSDITLDKSGTYKVIYTVKDSVGNEKPLIQYVTVSASGTSTPTTFTTLSTVLIIVAVVLLAGVIVYVVRFRKVKK